MTTIIGVDFSGARPDKNTWAAQGRLHPNGALLLDSVQPIRRDDLYDLLAGISTPAVAALDFPFGVPSVFLDHLHIPADTKSMKEVWPHITAMSLDQYRDKCRSFGTHPKRTGDKRYSVNMSALNSRLVTMTYRGIEMLHKLDTAYPNRWWIPPLDAGETSVDRTTLLEVMPGALLCSIGLDYAKVKGYKSATGALDTRDGVINRLAEYANAELGIPNLLDFRWGFRANDDCLDSVVAAVGAAMWARDSSRFLHPTDDELADAQLEGWIYAPAAATPVR